MLFKPTDVVARVFLNTRDAATADASMRECLDLVAELAPVSVAFEQADPAGLRHGFLVELMVVLPPAPAERPDEVLLTTVRPLIGRLGLDEALFALDDPSGRTGGILVPEHHRDERRTACGAYWMLAGVGVDPLTGQDTDEADYEGDGDDL
ncbi:hypothetical protein [Streptomyces sp. DH12]|uniref:hypothetical protein n=1 Tax=Streptomyces sp. DH12 TaxID=2857010 RepID=UPI001E60917A|nr:hypothetical protein [Streptomyces sp. DH12]